MIELLFQDRDGVISTLISQGRYPIHERAPQKCEFCSARKRASNIKKHGIDFVDAQNLWKDEEVNITFYIPENVTIYFDNSSRNFLSNVDNETDIYDKEMANHHFIMTDKTLQCTDCGIEVDDRINENDDKKVDEEFEETI